MMAQDAQRTGRAGDTLRKWIEVSQDALAAESDGTASIANPLGRPQTSLSAADVGADHAGVRL